MEMAFMYCARYEDAKEQYIKAISIEDDWAVTYWHYAMVLFDLGQYRQSETFVKKSYEMNQQIPIIADHYEQQMQRIESALVQQERDEKRAKRERLRHRDRSEWESRIAEDHLMRGSRKRGSVTMEGRDTRDTRNGHAHSAQNTLHLNGHHDPYRHRERDDMNLKSPTNQLTDSQSPTSTPQPAPLQRNGQNDRRRDGRGDPGAASNSDSENARHRDRSDRKRSDKKRKR